MGLTGKQEAFALRVVAGDSLADAYRAAYKPKRATEKSIWEKASQTAALVKVKSRIAELRAQVAQKTKYSLEEHLDQLRKLSLAACKVEQFGAAIEAEKSRGAASGFYAKKLEISGPGGKPLQTQTVESLSEEALEQEIARARAIADAGAGKAS